MSWPPSSTPLCHAEPVARTGWARPAPWIAFAGLAVLLWLYLASLLLAPWWGVAVLLVCWAGCSG